MRTLTDREKRTVRIATVGIAVYLVVFFGARIWGFLDKGRRDYVQLVQEARILRHQLDPYADKVIAVQKLMDQFHLDPAKLSKATVVADASAAIQKAAMTGAIQLGPVRETPARSSNKELAQIQLEGTGQTSAVLGFLSRLDSIGYPVIVDAVQMNTDNTRPGNVKVTLTIVILDFEQWKKEEPPNA